MRLPDTARRGMARFRPSLTALALLAFVSIPVVPGHTAGLQDLVAKPLDDALLHKSEKALEHGAERGRDPAATSLHRLGPLLMDNRAFLLGLVRTFAPPDWAPYLDAVSGVLDYADTLAKAEETLGLANGRPPDPVAARVIASPQFRRVASMYYFRNCRGYPIKLPPDPWPQATFEVIDLLKSPAATKEEKMCRTIALVSLSAPSLLADLAKVAR